MSIADTQNNAESDEYYRELLARVDDAITESAQRTPQRRTGLNDDIPHTLDGQTMKVVGKRTCKKCCVAMYKLVLVILAVVIELGSSLYEFIRSMFDKRDNSENANMLS